VLRGSWSFGPVALDPLAFVPPIFLVLATTQSADHLLRAQLVVLSPELTVVTNFHSFVALWAEDALRLMCVEFVSSWRPGSDFSLPVQCHNMSLLSTVSENDSNFFILDFSSTKPLENGLSRRSSHTCRIGTCGVCKFAHAGGISPPFCVLPGRSYISTEKLSVASQTKERMGL
jgi:hypothetical protein